MATSSRIADVLKFAPVHLPICAYCLVRHMSVWMSASLSASSNLTDRAHSIFQCFSFFPKKKVSSFLFFLYFFQIGFIAGSSIRV